MPQLTIHVIAAPLAVACGRMPESLLVGPAAVTVHRPSDSASHWRWETGSAKGTVTLEALTADTTSLAVTEDPGSAAGIADALTIELYGALERTWAPGVPSSHGAPMKRGRVIAVAAAVVLVPLLAVTGVRVMAPPKSMDVAAAVEQFRERSAAGPGGPAAQAASGRQAAPSAQRATGAVGTKPSRGGGKATNDDGRGRQVAATADAGASSTPATAGAASAEDSGQQDRGSAEPQTAPRRQQSGAEATGVPDEGVYRYATQGYESIDRPSSRHDYPEETAISIRHSDCGFTAHWQPLENRWDEMDVCRSGGESFLPHLSTHREFYGQANDSNYDCGAGNYAYRPEPGATWSGSCSDGQAKMQIRGRTLGIESISVGDQTVEAVHYALEARISGGDAEGTWTAERWIDPDTGILVRVEAQTNATSDSSVGQVNYREEVSLRLLSMTPER